MGHVPFQTEAGLVNIWMGRYKERIGNRIEIAFPLHHIIYSKNPSEYKIY